MESIFLINSKHKLIKLRKIRMVDVKWHRSAFQISTEKTILNYIQQLISTVANNSNHGFLD